VLRRFWDSVNITRLERPLGVESVMDLNFHDHEMRRARPSVVAATDRRVYEPGNLPLQVSLSLLSRGYNSGVDGGR
jgi:hypothetical protein